LERSHFHWNAITEQLTSLGLVDQEYCAGYDWYHQSEGNAMFQFLAFADPGNATIRTRLERFAGFLSNEGVPEPIFDEANRVFRAAHVGSRGPRRGISGEAVAWWDATDAERSQPPKITSGMPLGSSWPRWTSEPMPQLPARIMNGQPCWLSSLNESLRFRSGTIRGRDQTDAERLTGSR